MALQVGRISVISEIPVKCCRLPWEPSHQATWEINGKSHEVNVRLAPDSSKWIESELPFYLKGFIQTPTLPIPQEGRSSFYLSKSSLRQIFDKEGVIFTNGPISYISCCQALQNIEAIKSQRAWLQSAFDLTGIAEVFPNKTVEFKKRVTLLKNAYLDNNREIPVREREALVREFSRLNEHAFELLQILERFSEKKSFLPSELEALYFIYKENRRGNAFISRDFGDKKITCISIAEKNKFYVTFQSGLGMGAQKAVLPATDFLSGERVALNLIMSRSAFLNERRANRIFGWHNRYLPYEAMSENPFYSSWYDASFYILTSPLADRDLEKYLMSEKRTSDLNVLMDMALQITQGVLFSEENGFVHRDLKPANILVKGNRCFIIDLESMIKFHSKSADDVRTTPSVMSCELAQAVWYSNSPQAIIDATGPKLNSFQLGSILLDLFSKKGVPSRSRNRGNEFQNTKSMADLAHNWYEEIPLLAGAPRHIIHGLLDSNPENRFFVQDAYRMLEHFRQGMALGRDEGGSSSSNPPSSASISDIPNLIPPSRTHPLPA